jgi:hypothetical protein
MDPLLRDIGTIEWSRATRGVLRDAERWRYVVAVLLVTMRVTPRMLLAKAGLWGSGADPSDFTPPDTQLTRRVLEACADIDPMLVTHGIRSYLFARALGRLDKLSCDDEALFVAAVLHDFAFPVAPTCVGDRCFTVVGAEIAAELLRDSSLSALLQHDVLDAITLHLNPYVTRERGVLQHLLHAGVLVDAAGARAWQLDRHGVQRVVDKHPRLGFQRRGLPGFRAQAQKLPGTRPALALRCGFGMAQKLGPWGGFEALEAV